MRRRELVPAIPTAVLCVVLAAGCFGGGGPIPTPILPPIASFPDYFAQSTLAIALPSIAAGVGAVNVDSIGVLTDQDGFTLYTFDQDTPDVSVCTGDCTADFSPVTVPSVAALKVGLGLALTDFGTLTRDDGTIQVSFKHQPLYTYAGDENPGDMLGDGIGGDWRIARIGPAPSLTAAPSEATTRAPGTAARPSARP